VEEQLVLRGAAAADKEASSCVLQERCCVVSAFNQASQWHDDTNTPSCALKQPWQFILNLLVFIGVSPDSN
jgi:hypothetical protein